MPPTDLEYITTKAHFKKIKAGLLAGEHQAVLVGEKDYNPLAGASSFARSAEPFDQEPAFMVRALHALVLEGIIEPDFLSRELPAIAKNTRTLPLLLAYLNEYLEYAPGHRALPLDAKSFFQSIKAHPDFAPESSEMARRLASRAETAIANWVSPFAEPQSSLSWLKGLILTVERRIRKFYRQYNKFQRALGQALNRALRQPLGQQHGKATTSISTVSAIQAEPTQTEPATQQRSAISTAESSLSAQQLSSEHQKITNTSEAIAVLIVQLIARLPSCRAHYGLRLFLEGQLGLFVQQSELLKQLLSQGYIEYPDPEKTYLYRVTETGHHLLNQTDMKALCDLLKADTSKPALLTKICSTPAA